MSEANPFVALMQRGLGDQWYNIYRGLENGMPDADRMVAEAVETIGTEGVARFVLCATLPANWLYLFLGDGVHLDPPSKMAVFSSVESLEVFSSRFPEWHTFLRCQASVSD